MFSAIFRSKLLSVLREAICQNQGAYIEYSHQAHNLHKLMRVASEKDALIDTLAAHLQTLDDYLEAGLQEAIQRNFDLLDNVFHITDPYPSTPRICIKANKKDCHTPLAFDLSRHYNNATESHRNIINNPFPITQNSGFEYVAKTGDYFIEPNIPRAALSGYNNPRLQTDRARHYKQPVFFKRMFVHRDLGWEQCWQGYGTELGEAPPPNSCYKSTLIVPIGLSKLHLGSGLLATIRRLFPYANNLESLIFAYLCFDHTDTGYFREPEHVDLSYIFADVLSLFFARRWTLTIASNTYREIGERLRSKKQEEDKNWQMVS